MPIDVTPLEQWTALDAVADPLAGAVDSFVARSGLGPLLSGRWLGHPVHPVLTDLPIGFWTSAWVLDLVPTTGTRAAARRLVGLGVLSALPTAAAGWNDWSQTTGAARRVGFVHAVTNSLALLAYLQSWRARRHAHGLRGVGWAWAGAAAATFGGFLGGYLVFGSSPPDDDASEPAPPFTTSDATS